MLTFPTGLFVPSALTPELVGASVSGGQSLSGLAQNAATSGGGFWQITFGEAVLWDRNKFNTWRAIAAQSDGGATPFIVPLCDRVHQCFLPSQVKRGVGIGNGDDTRFSDGALWPAEYITATIPASAALRTTNLNIAIAGGAALTGGEFFTIWHATKGQRLYCVTQVNSQGDGLANITIRPPLREATASGVTLDFDNPRCQMNVVGQIAPTLEQLRFGKSPTLKFVENFQPPSLFP